MYLCVCVCVHVCACVCMRVCAYDCTVCATRVRHQLLQRLVHHRTKHPRAPARLWRNVQKNKKPAIQAKFNIDLLQLTIIFYLTRCCMTTCFLDKSYHNTLAFQ